MVLQAGLESGTFMFPGRDGATAPLTPPREAMTATIAIGVGVERPASTSAEEGRGSFIRISSSVPCFYKRRGTKIAAGMTAY